MKIIIIGPAYPYRGGIATFSVRMAGAFQEDGHEVSISTFSLQYPRFLFPGKTQYADDPAPKGIKIYRQINAVNPLNWMRVGALLKREKPDLVIVKYWLPFMGACLGTILRRIKRNKTTKVVAFLHNIIPHEERLGDRWLTSYFVKPVDAFISMSEAVMEDLSEFDQQKPRAFHPHPIFDHFGAPVSRKDAAEFLKLEDDIDYILFFGIVRDYKGLDWLLEAFSKTRAKKKAKLIIAGEFYADQQQYEKLIIDLGIKERVILHDHFIKNAEVKYYFSLANLVAQPYKNATQSGVTQIGYHFNCPMLVTKVGGLPEMIPDHKIGLVVAPAVDQIAAAIDEYFKDHLEETFKANFPTEKRKYSWEGLTDKIYSLYEKIK